MSRHMTPYGANDSRHKYALADYTFSRNHTKSVTIKRWKRYLKKIARQSAKQLIRKE